MRREIVGFDITKIALAVACGAVIRSASGVLWSTRVASTAVLFLLPGGGPTVPSWNTGEPWTKPVETSLSCDSN